MAKKKMSQRQDENNPNNQNLNVETKPTNIPRHEDVSNKKLEHLKSLNTLLLKEAVERRQQVDSLIQAKGSLESVLTRTTSVKDEMMSELTHLSEEALRLEIERDFVFDFFGLQVGKQSEDGMRWKEKMESERREIEKEMREVLKEKSEIEKVKIERDSEILAMAEKVKGLLNDICLEKGVSEKLERERDEMKVRLDVQMKEIEVMSLKFVEIEGKEKGVKEEMLELGKKYCSLVEVNRERKNEIEDLMSEKLLFETEAFKLIEEMEGKIATIEKEKEGIEEEMSLEKAKRVELENTVSRLNETVSSLDKAGEKLRMDVAEFETKCIEGEEKQEEMAMLIDQLVWEKNEMSKGLESVVEEKNLLEKNLDEALKQLDELKKETGIVENEKTNVLEVLSGKECEIGELKKEVYELRELVKRLESSSNEGIVKIKNLESDVAIYKDALDQVTVERDEDRRLIEAEKNKGLELLKKIEDMTKSIEEKVNLVEEVKAKNAGLIDERGELEILCGKLRNKLTSAESLLTEVRKEFDEFRSIAELEFESSNRVLNLLRGVAAEFVSSFGDDKNVIDGDKPVIGENSDPYVVELELIKNAFKRKEKKGEEMKRQVEFLKDCLAVEHKKRNSWALLSSATIILATISLAYIARGQ